MVASESSTEESTSIFSSFFIVAFATLLVVLFLRPRDPERTAPPRAANAHLRPDAAGLDNNTNNTNHATTSSSKSINRTACTKTPSHLAPKVIAHSGGANVLADGLVIFKATTASSSAAAIDASLRKDRARILTRLLMDGSDTASSNIVPPSKGGTMLISIPSSDVGCESLARVLFLLATYYNVFLVVAVTDDHESDAKKDASALQQEQKALVDKVYVGNDLTRSVLPPHRVVLSSTVAGRVAFARQLQRMEMVLDYESEVATNLSRFGYKVVLYQKNSTPRSDCGTSMLGQKLR